LPPSPVTGMVTDPPVPVGPGPADDPEHAPPNTNPSITARSGRARSDRG
jgi:hypothetical protein